MKHLWWSVEDDFRTASSVVWWNGSVDGCVSVGRGQQSEQNVAGEDVVSRHVSFMLSVCLKCDKERLWRSLLTEAGCMFSLLSNTVIQLISFLVKVNSMTLW